MAKKVVITHTYSLKNRGDYLLLKGTIAILKQILGSDTHFNVFSANPEEDTRILDEDSCIEFVNQIPYPVYNIRNLRRLVVSMTVGLIEYISLSIHIRSGQSMPLLFVPATHKKTIQSLIDSDYIIGRSIDQISDIFGFATLLRNLYVIWLVKILGKPVFLHSQTIYLSSKGLLGKISEAMLRRSLRNIHVSVREMVSFNYLKEIDVPAPFIPAPSYYSVQEFLPTFKKDSKDYVLVIPRIALSSSELENKIGSYTDLIESIVTKYDTNVVIMGQANVSGLDDDYTLIDKILSRLSATTKNKTTVEDISKIQIRDFCSRIFRSKLTISERFISCLLSLSMDVPVISIDPYGGKNRGIMMCYDMQDYCFNDPPKSNELMSSVEKIFDNYETITHHLKKNNEVFFADCIRKTRDWMHENM